VPRRRKKVFVAHDFSTDNNHKKRFRDAVGAALRSFNLDPVYADIDLLDDENLPNIIKKIKESRFSIIDITNYHLKRRGRVNLNAVFEYGLAMGKGRKTIMLFKAGKLDVLREFSDVASFIYEAYHSYNGLTKALRQRLKSFLSQLK
jgi:predicted nucleotide-binding protein